MQNIKNKINESRTSRAVETEQPRSVLKPLPEVLGKNPFPDKNVDKPDVLPAVRDSGDTSAAATAGLPPGAYDPKKDEKYQQGVKPLQKARPKEGYTASRHQKFHRISG
jgi:hypothetical protein